MATNLSKHALNKNMKKKGNSKIQNEFGSKIFIVASGIIPPNEEIILENIDDFLYSY